MLWSLLSKQVASYHLGRRRIQGLNGDLNVIRAAIITSLLVYKHSVPRGGVQHALPPSRRAVQIRVKLGVDGVITNLKIAGGR
jgi:hypothetical protein